MRYRATANDITIMKFVFSYTKYHGIVPTLQEAGEALGYSRQNARKKFQRMIGLGALKKISRGVYGINYEKMTSAIEDLYKEASKDFYKEVYISGNNA